MPHLESETSTSSLEVTVSPRRRTLSKDDGRCRAAGFADHIVKPIDGKRLLAAIRPGEP